MKKGKLIVIDGTDGSGKATQTELLIKRSEEHTSELQSPILISRMPSSA